MALEQYLALDLNDHGEIASKLFDCVDKEARKPSLSLTGDGDAGSASGNLTPAMDAWLASNITRLRQAAFNTVEAAAARIKLGGGVDGIVREIEQDRLLRHMNFRRAQETSAFYERNRAKLDELNESELEYRAIKTEMGVRDAKVPSKWLDYGVPALIMIPEFFMNYNSFLKLAGIVAIAVGLAAVVALGIAVSSFITGSFWKAYHYYMHPDDEVQRQKGYRRIAIASTLFVIALAAVGYARFQTVLAQVEAARILGLDPPNVAAQTAGLLAGNLLVFAIGAAITYLIHDENPEFAEKAVTYQAKKNEVQALKAKQLTPKLGGIEAAFKEDHKKMVRKAQLMDTQPDYSLINEQMGNIAAKDEEVIGLLKNYRTRLVEKICDGNPDFCFNGPPVDRQSGNASERIPIAEFETRPLHLYRSK